MAEANQENMQGQAGAGGGRRFTLKTILILLAVLLLEGAAISGAFLLSKGPAPVHAEGVPADEAALAAQPVEVLVVAEKFQNTRSGRPYLYDTEIFVVLKQKDEAAITTRIETSRAQITTAIATIFRRAEPSHLLEPELSTLTRQIKAALDTQFGQDEDGQPILQEVLIKKCMQFRSDV